MNAKNIVDRCHYFAALPAEHRRVLADLCLRETYSKGSFVFHEGSPVTGVYLVSAGCVQLVRTTPNGREIVIKTVEPGEIFGEAALLKHGTFPVTANVVKDTVLYRIPKHDFLSLLRHDDFRTDFEVGLMQRIQYLTERLIYLTVCDVEDRLFYFLREHYGEMDTYTIGIAKKDIAAEIGVTPESLSRLIRRLSEKGILKWEEKFLTLRSDFWESYINDAY